MVKMTPPLLGGWIGAAGAGTFFVGAAIATSVGVWGLSGAELLDGTRKAALAWQWGNALLAAGSAVSAVGMLLVASDTPTLPARSGAILWLVAGVSGLVGFVFQGAGTLRAASVWSDTGTIPYWYERVAQAAGAGIGIFMVGGIIGSVALGWSLRVSHSLPAALLTPGVVLLGVALIFAVLRIPAAAALLAGWVSVARLLLNSS